MNQKQRKEIQHETVRHWMHSLEMGQNAHIEFAKDQWGQCADDVEKQIQSLNKIAHNCRLLESGRRKKKPLCS